MNAVGVLIGLAFAAGIALVIRGGPPARRPGLDDRLAPYVGRAEVSRATVRRGVPAPAALGSGPAGVRPEAAARVGRGAWAAAAQALVDAGAWVAAGRALVEAIAVRLDRALPGGSALRRRLAAAGLDGSAPAGPVGSASAGSGGATSVGPVGSASVGSGGAAPTGPVAAFRVEQVRWAAVGLLGGVVSGVALGGGVGLALLGPIGALAGALGRDWWLTVEVRRRSEALRAELPVVAELLALAVTAGEAPAAALRRVTTVSRGLLGCELARVLDESRSGASLTTALEELAARSASEPLVRFVDGIVIALERGTPLADVLRAQAADAREAGHRSLLAAGGRREIAMMVPVVFLILPVTVLFALYPGLVSISMLSR